MDIKMWEPIQNRKLFLLVLSFFITLLRCKSEPIFYCLKRTGEPFPPLPIHYSTNIRLNFLKELQSLEIRQVVNEEDDKLAIEFWYPDGRHIKYINNKMDTLVVLYRKDSSPKCTFKPQFSKNRIFDSEYKEVGKFEILSKIMEVFSDSKNILSFQPGGTIVENGVFLKKWEGCFQNPLINISVAFTEKNWGNTFTSTLLKNEKYSVQLDAQRDDKFVTALFSNFNPVMPDESEFQPPENVYCDGYQSDLQPISIPNYFSYDSEIVVYESSFGIAPVISQRKVYYDFPAGISRTDFYDPLAEDQDLFSPVKARGISIIHDFNAGIQYSIDPSTGHCEVDRFQTKIGPINIVETKREAKMANGNDFFSLKPGTLSYNGQFPTRGLKSDVFSARIKDEDDYLVYTWYFSTNRTQVVEKDYVDKNVLLRMVVQPEAAEGKEDEVNVNFYNFLKEEPDPSVFDIRSCYEDNNSKSFVMTFPLIEELKGLEKLVKNYIYQSLKDATGVSKQRLFVSEVTFSGNYIYCEFKLLASPSVFGKNPKQKTNDIPLEEAVAKLKKAVTEKTFNVSIQTKEKLHTLRAEPDGLNELAGDRRRSEGTHYKEGSVIALTIGMLFLGIILGSVTLNLIISRKFGVSLFQKSNHDKNYSGSLNESYM